MLSASNRLIRSIMGHVTIMGAANRIKQLKDQPHGDCVAIHVGREGSPEVNRGRYERSVECHLNEQRLW